MTQEATPIFRDDQILILGTVKNAAENLADNVRELDRALLGSERTWFVVESNSTDDTVGVLSSLAATVTNFNYISLGRALESRTNALFRAREKYHSWALDRREAFTKVLIIDLDQKYLWSDVRLETSLTNYDALFCHQDPYYDTFAYKDESGADFLPEIKFLPPSVRRAINFIWYSPRLQLRLGSLGVPLKVRSAFGGMAVYSQAAFTAGSYIVDSFSRRETCEHLVFNEKISGQFSRLYIDPSFKVPVRNEHTRISSLVRQMRNFRK